MSLNVAIPAVRGLLVTAIEGSGAQNVYLGSTLRGTPKIAVIYRVVNTRENVASSDGQILYESYLFQVVATTIADTISPLVDLVEFIKSALHFPADRLSYLPGGIRSMQVEREVNFEEPTASGDVRQNYGVMVRVVV